MDSWPVCQPGSPVNLSSGLGILDSSQSIDWEVNFSTDFSHGLKGAKNIANNGAVVNQPGGSGLAYSLSDHVLGLLKAIRSASAAGSSLKDCDHRRSIGFDTDNTNGFLIDLVASSSY